MNVEIREIFCRTARLSYFEFGMYHFLVILNQVFCSKSGRRVQKGPSQEVPGRTIDIHLKILKNKFLPQNYLAQMCSFISIKHSGCVLHSGCII